LDFGAEADEPFNFSAHGIVVEIEIAQNVDCNPLAEFEEPEKDVLCAKVVVV